MNDNLHHFILLCGESCGSGTFMNRIFFRLFHNHNENMPSDSWCPGLIASWDVPTQEDFPTRSRALFYFLLSHSGLWINKISFPKAMVFHLCKKLSTYLPKWLYFLKFPPAMDDNFCCSVSLPSFFRVSGIFLFVCFFGFFLAFLIAVWLFIDYFIAHCCFIIP